ncbi:hypothetical protein X777_16241 [Ooceraea biroi]|uniref:Uncharacterized protein n=1 Tax=Ooceraea biroi TaxID=2015173 RepID=A0A026VUV0_OOCBI|nr:hypothetical protein X777_16241 [Ooceraea biroi]
MTPPLPGRPVSPIKAKSISFAANRPSAIAHTTRDCPRLQSIVEKYIIKCISN